MRKKIVIFFVMLLFIGVFIYCAEAMSRAETVNGVETFRSRDAKVSMDFEKAALKDVLKAFSKQAGINFISSDAIEGKVVTVYLNNVSVEDALYSILEANGLSYEKQGDSLYLVKPSGTERIKTITKVFRLNYLQVYKMSVTEGTATSTSGITIIGSPAIAQAGSTGPAPSAPSGAPGSSGSAGDNDEPKSVVDVIRTLMSKHGKIVADRRNNSLIVTDIPDVFDTIERTLKELDIEPQQIMIQVEIIETTTTALKRLGLEYGGSESEQLLKFTYGNFRTPTPYPLTNNFIKEAFATSLANSALFRYGTLTVTDAAMVIKLISQDENTKYLSKPRIMTINNEPAVIKVSANTAIGVDSISVTQTSQVIEKAERAETGIVLRVTPQVNSLGDIFMYIEPSVSRATASTFFSTRFMDPNYRSSASTVMVKDGDTVVIGGLIQNNNFKTTRKIPILGDIPVLGEPFTSKYKRVDDTELLIFVTPHIVVKRDGQIIIPPEVSERERMTGKAIDEYSKKRHTAAWESKNKSKTEKKKEDAAMSQTMQKYSAATTQPDSGKNSKNAKTN